MLQPSDDDLVVLLNVLAPPALRNQVDSLGSATDKNDLPRRTGVEEAPRLRVYSSVTEKAKREFPLPSFQHAGTGEGGFSGLNFFLH
jgi:hypothetical protein